MTAFHRPALPPAVLNESSSLAEKSKLKRRQRRRKSLEARTIPVPESRATEEKNLCNEPKTTPKARLAASPDVELDTVLSTRELRNVGSLSMSVKALHTATSFAGTGRRQTPKPLHGAHTVIDPMAFRLPIAGSLPSADTTVGRGAVLAGASRPYKEGTDDPAAIDVDVLVGPSRPYTVEWDSSSVTKTFSGNLDTSHRPALSATEDNLLLTSIKIGQPLPRLLKELGGGPDFAKDANEDKRYAADAFALQRPLPVGAADVECPSFPSKLKARLPEAVHGPHAEPTLIDTEDVDEIFTPPPAAQLAAVLSSAEDPDFSAKPKSGKTESLDLGEIIVPGTPSRPHLDSQPSAEPSPKTLVTLQSKSKNAYGAVHRIAVGKGQQRLATGWKTQSPAPAQQRKRKIEQDTQALPREETKLMEDDPFLVCYHRKH